MFKCRRDAEASDSIIERCRMSFIGKDVTLNIYSPDIESPIITPQTRTVSREVVEFSDTSRFDSTPPNDGFEVVNADIDIGGGAIVYTIDDAGGAFSPSGFNGFVITDTDGTIRRITDVTIASDDFGLSDADIRFTENSIAVNFSGLSFDRGDRLVLQVTFREPGPPQPAHIVGTDSDDNLSGFARDDRINGKGGSDVLDGKAGADFIIGEDGSDVIIGGLGEDLLAGGKDADRYVYTSTEDSHGKQADLIAGFLHGVDKIDLQAIDANVHIALNQAFRFIGDAHFSGDGSGGELRYTLVDNSGLLNDRTFVQADVDGDGIADLGISLNHLVGLTSDDFIL